MARFHVKTTFATEDKAVFVLAGFVIEGELADGMSLRLPFRDDMTVTAPIDHVETIRRADGNVTCLALRCHAPGELALWDALKLQERILDLMPAA